jgi:hypothetical protein
VGFVRASDRDSLIVAPDANSLLSVVAAFVPPRHRYDKAPEGFVEQGPVTAAEA